MFNNTPAIDVVLDYVQRRVPTIHVKLKNNYDKDLVPAMDLINVFRITSLVLDSKKADGSYAFISDLP